MLQIVQEKAEKQRHEREKGFCTEIDALRQENFMLRSGKGVMADSSHCKTSALTLRYQPAGFSGAQI